MPTAMSAKQIAQVAYNAGWRGEQLVIATAVALAESSGRYWVVNSIGCVGLWQINVPVHKQWNTGDMKDPAKNAAAAMTQYKRAGNKWTPWEAYTGPDGRGSDGPYTAQMGRARIAAAQIKGGGAVDVDQDVTGGGGINSASFETISGGAVPANALEDFLRGLMGGLVDNSLGALEGTAAIGGGIVSIAKAALAVSVAVTRGAAWVAEPRNWLRVVEVLGGGAALFIGLKMLAESGVGGPVAGAVKVSVDAAGKAAGVAKTAATGGRSAVAGAAKGLK